MLVGVSKAQACQFWRDDARVKQNIPGHRHRPAGRTELAWRWRDSIIYLTHGVPGRAHVRNAAIVDRVAGSARRHSRQP